MANPAYPPGAFFKTKMVEPRVIAKARKDKHEQQSLRDVYKKVDRRDRHFCQITNVLLSPGHPDAKRALTRHHLEERSLNKSRRFTEYNIWTVSQAAHQLITAKAIVILDKQGEKALDVREIYKVAWNREMVPRGTEPFRIRYKRAGAI